MSKQIESKVIEELAENVDNPGDAAALIMKMDNLIKSKKNNILMIDYQQDEIFRRFKTNSKLISTVSAFKISKITINFKIDIVEFIDMYPKMQASCISLYYLKNNFRVIKEVYQEHDCEFQEFFFGKHISLF